ncbi:putative signal peptide protein, partial [Lasiosphaeris hirsuta]
LGLFAYGTLTMDSVVQILLGRIPPSELTSALGWRAAGLPDLSYPGLVADQSGDTPGRLYLDLTEDEWILLDAFENPLYDVAPLSLANGHRGLAYVWPSSAPQALTSTWTVDSINAATVEKYLENCVAWREEWHKS